MRIVSWNVNSVAVRQERLCRLLDRLSPDVVCLQELKCVDEKFPYEAIRSLGFHAAVYGQKTYNGVAILSKEPPISQMRGFGDGDDDPAARFIINQYPSGLEVGSLYVPNGQAVGTEKYAYKLRWLERLKRYLEARGSKGQPMVLAGDYNIAPEDRDVYDPLAWYEQVLCSSAERAALQKLKDLGYVDAYRALYPETVQYTWWDYRGLSFPKNLGLRIDLMLVSRDLAPRLKGSFVDREERKGEKPSDHAPLVVDLDLASV